MDIQVQYALEVMEGIAATVDQGVYNLLSYTPLNPLALDATAQALLEEAAGTSLDVMKNNLGEVVGYCAKGAAQAGNGAATEVSTQVSVLTKEVIVDAEMAAQEWKDVATGEAASLTVGQTVTTLSASAGGAAGILSTSVPAAGVAIGIALGVVSGYLLYDIAPEFWTSVSDKLLEAGELIDGKVKGIINSNKQTSFSEKTIEIYKKAFVESGIFTDTQRYPENYPADEIQSYGENYVLPLFSFEMDEGLIYEDTHTMADRYRFRGLKTVGNPKIVVFDTASNEPSERFVEGFLVSRSPFLYNPEWCDSDGNPKGGSWGDDISADYHQLSDTFGYYGGSIGNWYHTGEMTQRVPFSLLRDDSKFYEPFILNDVAQIILQGSTQNPNTQEGATLPSENPFTDTYPDWQPNNRIQDEDYYPVSMPTNDNTQAPAQSGDNDEDEQEDIIGSLLFNPDPIPSPQPQPDPDPQPEPEQETPTPTPTPVPDPLNPNPEPDPSDPSPTLPIISGISASHMVTVYNPTDVQVNALGAFLWVDSVIEQIRLIFQDPMDGIISLHKIYAPPVTGSMKDIYLGYMDSGVDALEVTNQFTTVNCGSISISEEHQNATDYPPYTQAHIYLPFIGIEEIDVAEIMGGTVRVQYRVDAYTGTCVAQIFVTRSPDMGTEQMLYTFSGNASQTIPLTSSNFTGLVSSLVSIAGGAATAGAGGALLAAGRGLTSHMASVSHSGSISANAGIMGPRKPYLILTRQHAYDANGYNSIYGYPANTTRYLSNCTGFVRVKDVLYRGDGTEAEKNEIVTLLKNGVIA